MTKHRTGQHERAMRDRGVYDAIEFEQWLDARSIAWQKLERGDYDFTVDEALAAFTIDDPVRWAETYLIEPDSGDPYRLFDYQRESIRAFGQDVVHKDAAEIGKTREIVVLLLWTCCTGMGGRIIHPSCLVVAPQQVHLDDIASEIENQMGVIDGAEWKSPLQSAWLRPKYTPHKLFRFRCPNPHNPARGSMAKIHFRPAGHDGEAFRGVHVNALAIVEEAAKMKAKLHWTEFFRAMKPGCRLRVYSVPDGDRNSEYYRLTQEARIGLPDNVPGFRLFHWRKPMMPPPFWSPERERELIKLFGGRDTPGYVRNVLGEDGDAENPVFRWGTLLPNVVDLPDFRKMLIVADDVHDDLSLNVDRIDLIVNDGKKSGNAQTVADTTVALKPYVEGLDEDRRREWRELLAPFLGAVDARGVFWAGADLGERNDPTEIIISEEVGTELRDVLRVKARGLPYHAQKELIYQLDRAFGHRPHWGIDLGSAGTAVVKDLLTLESFADARFDDRLIGFHFQEAFDMIGEDGEALRDPKTDDILRAPAKHWSTQCVVERMQHHGYRIAYDGDALNDFASHTARAGTKWPIYSKQGDHTIDARRLQMLRKLRADDSGIDVFSVGTHERRAA